MARAPEVRAMDKSPDAFRTISEVAEDLDLPQHVLRFWETRFPQIKPLKRGGGRRYYRPDDVDLLRGIRQLLYGQGYTIKGVQRILKQDGSRFVQSIGRGERTIAAPPPGAADEPDDGVPFGSEPAQSTAPAPWDNGAYGVIAPAPESTRDALPYATPEPRSAGLSPADVRRLRAALDELLECERVLAALNTFDDGSSDRAP
jgi:DNA-binding transcriptional MerR regulator